MLHRIFLGLLHRGCFTHFEPFLPIWMPRRLGEILVELLRRCQPGVGRIADGAMSLMIIGITIGTSGTAAACYRRDRTSGGGSNVVVSRSHRRMTHDLATGQDVTL